MSTAVQISTAGPSKRKKPPACDSCKLRRVLCHPQPNGPCPRCAEKGVDCTTTPVLRRKRRTKAEPVLSAANDASDPSSSSTPINGTGSAHFSTSATPVQSNWLFAAAIVQPQFVLVSNRLDEPSPVPPTLQMSTKIVQELLEVMLQVYQVPPDNHLQPVTTSNPILPVSQLKTKLQLHSWNLQSLSIQDRVLAHCLLTFSAMHSTSSFVIGPGEVCVEEFQILASALPLKSHVIPDLRQYGLRREPVVRQLWAEALWLANQAGIATTTSKENAASCWLLGYLCYAILGKGGSAYSAAYLHHLRTLAEEGRLPTEESELLMLRGHMISDTVPALMAGRNNSFTLNDEFLLVPRKPEPLEQVTRRFMTKICSTSDIFLSIHTFAHNITRLARETVERLTGTYARSQPLDECFLINHFASLDLLHSYLSATLQQISYHSTQSRSVQDRTYYLRACSHGFVVCWGSLIIVLFELLKDRTMCYTMTDNATGGDGFSSGLTNEMSSRRLLMHLHHVRKLASRTAVEMCEGMRGTPSITRLSPPGDLVRWVRFLLESENIVDITHAQYCQTLECFRDALKLVGFSLPDRTGTVDTIDEHLASYVVDNVVDNVLTQLGQQNLGWTHVHDYSNAEPDWLEIGL